jgi:hypothetical protein
MRVSFVQGHARRTGWVVAHVRRPNRAEDGQLPLLAVLPLPRFHEPDEEPEPLSSARKSAITRS